MIQIEKVDLTIHLIPSQWLGFLRTLKATLVFALLRNCNFKERVHLLLVFPVFLIDYCRLYWYKKRVQNHLPSTRFVAIALIEHIGDVVACEPISRYIKDEHPNSYVVWFVRDQYRELVDANPYVDKTWTVYCLTEWILFATTRLFDEVVDLHLDGRMCPICGISLRKEGGVKITFENYLQFGSLLATFCQSAGIPVVDGAPRVYISPDIVSKIDSLGLPARFIVIHATSNDLAKDWTRVGWHELTQRLVRDGYYVVEVGRSSVLANFESLFYINLCGRLSILETAEVIRRACLFIGVDSGPAHLANATGTPGVVLLGHFRMFKKYQPYTGLYASQDYSNLVYIDGLVSDLSVSDVYQVSSKALAKIYATH